jgi:hypothetical protein
VIHGSRLDDFIQLSAGIRGWTWGEEARELARISFLLPAGSNIVEIGCFLGASTILLAGPRRLRGSRVDPWVQIHQGRAAEVGRKLGGPYRLANCRRGGVSRKCSRILRHLGAVLKTGGAIASHNSRPENRVPEHDGLRRLVQEKITAPYYYYENVRLVLVTTFAIKC